MRWCYKTVHFPMKKEGFLGSGFFDEAEVEQSLNEYGQAGWELTSILETQDGLIAFFKQPLGTNEPRNQNLQKVEEDGVSEDNEPILAPTTTPPPTEANREEHSSDDDNLYSIRIE